LHFGHSRIELPGFQATLLFLILNYLLSASRDSMRYQCTVVSEARTCRTLSRKAEIKVDLKSAGRQTIQYKQPGLTYMVKYTKGILLNLKLAHGFPGKDFYSLIGAF